MVHYRVLPPYSMFIVWFVLYCLLPSCEVVEAYRARLKQQQAKLHTLTREIPLTNAISTSRILSLSSSLSLISPPIKTRLASLYDSGSYEDKVRYNYLERMVKRKRIEVDELLRQHQEVDDPLVMRMSYMATKAHYNLTKCIKREYYGKDELIQMSVMVDMKRRSPTIPHQTNIIDYLNAAEFCKLLATVHVDAFMINTDDMEYGGSLDDLKTCTKAMKAFRPEKPPACIHKDIIIHPIQIAQALELGASGVLLNLGVVGGDLETLLDAATIMGAEAMVEIHSPNELDYALSKGATLFLVNMWDRLTGKLYPDQAKMMATMMPINVCAAVAGNIHTMKQVEELGFHGYDCVVLGRQLAELPDIKKFVREVHDYKGPPRMMGMGMKSTGWAYRYGPGGPENVYGD